MARPHENLDAWKQAMRLITGVYLITRTFPRDETYGLSSQMRRAAVSTASNLAEGAARSKRREFAQFIRIAMGSLSELETQTLIASELLYLPREHEIFSHLERVAQLLYGLQRNVSR